MIELRLTAPWVSGEVEAVRGHVEKLRAQGGASAAALELRYTERLLDAVTRLAAAVEARDAAAAHLRGFMRLTRRAWRRGAPIDGYEAAARAARAFLDGAAAAGVAGAEE